MDYVIVGILVVLSGIFSGLTLGLFSLNLTALERKIRLGNKKALRVHKVRKRGNLLLCTLLLGNVAVNSAIAVFLGSIATGFVAGLVATGLIVVFGEILPQAVFSRYALALGARTTWLVHIFMVLLFPVAGPLAWGLDKMLGKELPTIWSKQEIEEIIKLHEDSPQSSIDKDEERIMLGALSYSDKLVGTILTPRTVVFALEWNTPLSVETLHLLREKGFSRVPIYQEDWDHVVGVLLVKKLLGVEPDKKRIVGDLCHEDKLIRVQEDTRLDDLLNRFLENKSHMAAVFNEYGVFLGVATMEDVLEEILKTEIVDEHDITIDMQALARKRFAK